MIAFFVWIIGLLGTVVLIAGGLTYILVTLANRRLGPVLVPAGMLCGYIVGALFVWTLVSRDWALPFWTTLAATVNAENTGTPLSIALRRSSSGLFSGRWWARLPEASSLTSPVIDWGSVP